MLYYTAVAGDTLRVVVPTHNDLLLRIMYECHDAPPSGHRGREKTYRTVSRTFYLPRKYIRACEVCQRVKPVLHPVRHYSLYQSRHSAGSPFQ